MVAPPGSPVRIGPRALAMCALLTCGHYLPVGRATALLETLTGRTCPPDSPAGARRRAAKKLTESSCRTCRSCWPPRRCCTPTKPPAAPPVRLAYVHVACTEYLTLMHVGGRSSDRHRQRRRTARLHRGTGPRRLRRLRPPPPLHAWCGAHLLRDLRSISDADPDGQLWATAMADTLTAAHQAAASRPRRGRDRLDPDVLATIRNHYLGALANGTATKTAATPPNSPPRRAP